ncbi:MAG: hypothetical protein WA912_06210 [Ornithinimicrobium sp.]
MSKDRVWSTGGGDGTGDTDVSGAQALAWGKDAAHRRRQVVLRQFAGVLIFTVVGYVMLLVLYPFGDGGAPIEQAAFMGVFFCTFMGPWFWFIFYRPQARRLRDLEESDAVEQVVVLGKGPSMLTVGRLSEGGEEISLLVGGKRLEKFEAGQKCWRHFCSTKNGWSTVIVRTGHSPTRALAGPARVRG